jgi:hypothetical protein
VLKVNQLSGFGVKRQAAAADSNAVTENFEGTGTPVGWTVLSGTPNFDQSTAGLALEAAQCLFIDGNVNQEEAYVNFPDSDNCYVYIMFRWEDLPSASRRQWSLNNGASTVCEVGCVTGPTQWQVFDTATGTQGISTLSADTTYHVWFERIKGTGTNEIIRIYFSTDGIKPASPDTNKTNGTGTGQVNRFVAGTWGAGGGNMYYDKLRISITAPFGDNPA